MWVLVILAVAVMAGLAIRSLLSYAGYEVPQFVALGVSFLVAAVLIIIFMR